MNTNKPSEYHSLPAEINRFDLILNTSTLTISPGKEQSDVIHGILQVELNKPLADVRAIDVRFVGGMVVSLTDHNYPEPIKRGHRLFDKQVTVLDTSSSTVRATSSKQAVPTTLSEKQYHFPFQLKIPKGLPPSSGTSSSTIDKDVVRTQYLIVAGLHFSYGCWGWFPGLARNSVVATKEISVRCCPVLSQSYLSRLEKIPYLSLNRNLDHEADSQDTRETAETWLGLLTWKPADHIDVHLPPLFEKRDGEFMVHIISASELKSLKIDWRFLQQEVFSSVEGVPKKEIVINEGSIIEMERGNHKGVDVAVVEIPVLEVPAEGESGPPVIEKRPSLLEDLDTQLIQVAHTLELTLSWKKDRDFISQFANIPIIVYEKSIETGIYDVDNNMTAEESVLASQSSETTLVGRESQIRMRKSTLYENVE